MRRRWWWLVLVAAMILAPIAWYLGSPLFIDRRVDEGFPGSEASQEAQLPMSTGATVPEGMTQEQAEQTMRKASETDVSTADEMPADAAAAVVVARGTFVGADSFHRGVGTATIYRTGDTLLLRFEQFKVTNGPDLYVILTSHPAPRSRADVQQAYVEVGKLKGSVGSQNYALPAEADLGTHRAVVIYCKPFHVVFATASLGGTK